MTIIQTYIGISTEDIKENDLIFAEVNDKGEVQVRKYKDGEKKIDL